MYNSYNKTKSEWLAKRRALNDEYRENKARVRETIEADIKAFLEAGNKIQRLPILKR